MMDLSKEARDLLDSARHADAAPHAVRQRVHRRLIDAIAAGTVGTSAVVAKGAALSVVGTAKVGIAVGAGTPITTGLFGAVVAGLALGMVAITPAGKRTDAPVTQPPAAAVTAARTTVIPHQRVVAPLPPATSNAPAAIELPPAASALASTPVPRSTEPSGLRNRDEAPSSVTSNESLPELQPAVPNPAPALGSVGMPPSSKASIARETELLAGVHRALLQSRPATALSILNRYSTEFPAGELQEESVASRVVALCDFGRREDAARWRAEFLRRYPNSPLSARVRGACSGTAGEK